MSKRNQEWSEMYDYEYENSGPHGGCEKVYRQDAGLYRFLDGMKEKKRNKVVKWLGKLSPRKRKKMVKWLKDMTTRAGWKTPDGKSWTLKIEGGKVTDASFWSKPVVVDQPQAPTDPTWPSVAYAFSVRQYRSYFDKMNITIEGEDDDGSTDGQTPSPDGKFEYTGDANTAGWTPTPGTTDVSFEQKKAI